jgi:hypothetical protein
MFDKNLEFLIKFIPNKSFREFINDEIIIVRIQNHSIQIFNYPNGEENIIFKSYIKDDNLIKEINTNIDIEKLINDITGLLIASDLSWWKIYSAYIRL